MNGYTKYILCILTGFIISFQLSAQTMSTEELGSDIDTYGNDEPEYIMPDSQSQLSDGDGNPHVISPGADSQLKIPEGVRATVTPLTTDEIFGEGDVATCYVLDRSKDQYTAGWTMLWQDHRGQDGDCTQVLDTKCKPLAKNMDGKDSCCIHKTTKATNLKIVGKDRSTHACILGR